MSDTLFPPTPEERLNSLECFIGAEKAKRQAMLDKHPENATYWRARVVDAQHALDHVEALRSLIPGGG